MLKTIILLAPAVGLSFAIALDSISHTGDWPVSNSRVKNSIQIASTIRNRSASTSVHHSRLNVYAIAGIVVAVVIAIGLAATGALYFLRHRRHETQESALPQYPLPSELERSRVLNSSDSYWGQQNNDDASEIYEEADAYIRNELQQHPSPVSNNSDMIQAAKCPSAEEKDSMVELETGVSSPKIETDMWQGGLSPVAEEHPSLSAYIRRWERELGRDFNWDRKGHLRHSS